MGLDRCPVFVLRLHRSREQNILQIDYYLLILTTLHQRATDYYYVAPAGHGHCAIMENVVQPWHGHYITGY